MSSPMNKALVMQNIQQKWQTLAPRERAAVTVAAAVVLAAAVWQLGIAPARATLKAAPAKHAALNAQLEAMQAMQAESKAMQAQPKISYADAVRQLEALVKDTFGAQAELKVAGDQALLSLKAADAQRLAQFLSRSRSVARAVARDAQLKRDAASAPAVTWSGTLNLRVAGQ
jgi:general secretion pathway protein M